MILSRCLLKVALRIIHLKFFWVRNHFSLLRQMKLSSSRRVAVHNFIVAILIRISFSGHYHLPEYSKTQLQLTGKSNNPVFRHPDDLIIEQNVPAAKRVSVLIQTDIEDALQLLTELRYIWSNITTGNISSSIPSRILSISMSASAQFIQRQGIMSVAVLILLVFVVIIFGMVWSLYSRVSLAYYLCNLESNFSLPR
jgi:hypothetical protein